MHLDAVRGDESDCRCLPKHFESLGIESLLWTELLPRIVERVRLRHRKMGGATSEYVRVVDVDDAFELNP